MKIIYTILSVMIFSLSITAQTSLTEAVDFTAKTTEGETIHLFEYLEQDKLVVIDFFSTSCGPCAEYAPEIQASHEDFGSNEGNVIFLGICWGDSDEGVAYFDSVHGITYPSVSGFDGGGNQIMSMYQIQSYPTVILIDTDGTILNQYIWEPTNENINNEVIAAGGILTSVEDNFADNLDDISIYPSPANEKAFLNFFLEKNSMIEIRLFDILGNEIEILKKEYLLSGDHKIGMNVSEYKPGTYLVGIIRDNRLINTQRLIVAN